MFEPHSTITFLQLKQEFRESDVSPCETKVKQGKFIEFLSQDERLF